jgi:hypothetical protein
MPYITQEMRVPLRPCIDKVVERAERKGDVTPSRVGEIIEGLLICTYQEECPIVGSAPYDVMIVRDLISTILTEFEPAKRWGVLNYCVCKLIVKTILARKFNYNQLQAVMEALEAAREHVSAKPLRGLLRCVEHEFYRRVVAPYEDTKIACEENGDVF